VHIDDINNSRIVEDVYIPSGVTSDVDELVNTNIPTLDETHVHEESMNDVHYSLVKSSTPAVDDSRS